MVATAALQDFGMVTDEDNFNVVDRYKVRNARKKNRSELKKELHEVQLEALFFDNRKDNTLVQIKMGDKYHRKTVTEEHVSIIAEPGSLYVGHVTPQSGTADNIKTSIVNFMDENAISSDCLQAVGCDGTNVNTGNKNGVIRLLEQHIGRPLQWLVCLFHFNELPLRHLFQFLDGKTYGPREFSGPIGKNLQTCIENPVTEFDKIVVDFPSVVAKELSTDQKYLHDMCQAIKIGECSFDLSQRDPGKMAHSRWLTTANRILRLYVGTENPSPNLKTLTEFILKVYARMSNDVKR